MQELAAQMSQKYEVPIVPASCMDLDENEIKRILASILFEFPVKEICVEMPRWISTLDKEHWLRSAVFSAIPKRRTTGGKNQPGTKYQP